MGLGGIYEILNTVNGKRYIGSAVNFSGRFHGHRSALRRGKHGNSKLQNAWSKYGAGAFKFSQLLICSPKDLIFYEQRVIDRFRPFYNICKTAGSSLGRKASVEVAQNLRTMNVGRKHPPEFGAAIAARKIGSVLSDETKEKIRISKLGTKASDATRAKMSALRLRMSDATRAKMSAAHKGNQHLLGHVHSEISRRRISASLRLFYANKQRAETQEASV